MIPVQDIIDRVTDLLLDKDRADDEARWSNDELVRWINDSRMAILTRRPSACSKIASLQLVAGTQQRIPTDGVLLLDIIRNMGMDGNTPGRAIRRTDRQNIDDIDPDWHAATQSTVISQFTYDDRTPYDFFVSPPAKAGAQILISYAAVPAEVTISDNLDVGIESLDAVVNYVAYRAKSKDSEYANAGEASAYYSAFTDALGVTKQNQVETSPNQPGNSV